MIDINLLPEELRLKESRFKKIDLSIFNLDKIDIKRMPVVGIGISVICVFVLIHVVLFLLGINSTSSLRAISKESARLAPEKRKADALRNELDLINRKVSAIDGLMVKRFSWTEKLDSLSDSITSGIWLTELSYDEKAENKLVTVNAKTPNGKSKREEARSLAEKVIKRYLVISGYASSMGEQGTALIGKFIKSLRDNPEFYSHFNEIKLDSIKSGKFLEQEIMNFKITCLFKDEG